MGFLKKREVLRCLYAIGGSDGNDDYAKGWDQAIDTAIKEIEGLKAKEIDETILQKQEPFSPEPYHQYEGKCRCGAVFLDRTTNYCGNCGQKLNWEEKPDWERDEAIVMSDNWVKDWRNMNVCTDLIKDHKASIVESGKGKYTRIRQK